MFVGVRAISQCLRACGSQAVFVEVQEIRPSLWECGRSGGVCGSVGDQEVLAGVQEIRRCLDECRRSGGVCRSAGY